MAWANEKAQIDVHLGYRSSKCRVDVLDFHA